MRPEIPGAAMRRLATSVVALVWAGACSPAPSLSVEDARTIVDDVGRGAARVDVCTEEGRATYRAAVRVYSAEQAAQGKVWPNVMAALSGDHTMDGGEAAVMGAIIAGYVRASDLAGDAGRVSQMLNMSINLNDQRNLFRNGMRDACAEVMELQQLVAREQVYAGLMERRAARALERGDEARAREIRYDLYEHSQRIADDVQRLTTAIEAKIAANKN